MQNLNRTGDNIKDRLATASGCLYYRFQNQPDKEAVVLDGARSVIWQPYENTNVLG